MEIYEYKEEKYETLNEMEQKKEEEERYVRRYEEVGEVWRIKDKLNKKHEGRRNCLSTYLITQKKIREF